jgi:hypothetical protein
LGVGLGDSNFKSVLVKCIKSSSWPPLHTSYIHPQLRAGTLTLWRGADVGSIVLLTAAWLVDTFDHFFLWVLVSSSVDLDVWNERVGDLTAV